MSEPLAAIILCGGRGRRMGGDKAFIPIDGRTMLERVVEAVSGFAVPVVLAARPRQVLPAFPGRVMVVTDQRPDVGPLEGIRAGLDALHRFACANAGRGPSSSAGVDPVCADAGRSLSSHTGLDVTAACVCACDQPLVSSALFAVLARHLTTDVAGVIPCVEGRLHPLTALYRTRLAPAVERLLETGERRAAALADLPGVRVVTDDDGADLTSMRRAFVNVNTPEELRELERGLLADGDARCGGCGSLAERGSTG